MKKKLVTALGLAIALAFISGCSSITPQQLQAIQQTADQALAEAKEARLQANQAQNLASEAAYEAEQAKNSASNALECCNENTTRLDRMFEKAMMK